MWKRKRKVEAEAVEAEAMKAVNFLWKKKHFDKKGRKRMRTWKQKR